MRISTDSDYIGLLTAATSHSWPKYCMKKAEKQGTLSLARLKQALNRSQSTGNIFTAPKPIVPICAKPIGRATALKRQALPRAPSVTVLVTETLPDLVASEALSGKLELPSDSVPPKKGKGTPMRVLSKTPAKGRVADRASTPGLRRKKPDLNRSKVEMSLPAVTESAAGKASETSIYLRRKQKEALPASKRLFDGRNRGFHSISDLPTDLFLPDTVTKVLFQTRTGAIGGRCKPHNQDSLLHVPHFHSTKHQKLLGVFDGHGDL